MLYQFVRIISLELVLLLPTLPITRKQNINALCPSYLQNMYVYGKISIAGSIMFLLRHTFLFFKLEETDIPLILYLQVILHLLSPHGAPGVAPGGGLGVPVVAGGGGDGVVLPGVTAGVTAGVEPDVPDEPLDAVGLVYSLPTHHKVSP